MCDIIHRIRPYNCCSIESWPGQVPLIKNQADGDRFANHSPNMKTTTNHRLPINRCLSSPKKNILVDFTWLPVLIPKITVLWPQNSVPSISIALPVYGVENEGWGS